MTLHVQVEAIQTREDLVSFVRALRRDFMEHPEAWENSDLETFFEAMAEWIADMDGYYRNRGEPVPEQPTWKVFGQILLAAVSYE